MKKIAIVLFMILISTSAHAKHFKTERYFQDIWCNSKSGQTEVIMSDKTRCDCIIEEDGIEYAVEVDFSSNGKWYEGISQALHYAMLTGKQPGLLLIIERDSDLEFVKRAMDLIEFYKLGITVWTIKYTDHESNR